MLDSQKYKSLQRTVSGTVNVEKDDVVLNVTTSSVAATINLQTIPANYFSVEYKLYIFDNSANAQTNNITIVAPAGYTINGSSTATINTNNGSAIVRIVNNTAYQAQLSSFSSTNTPLPYLYSQKLLQNPAVTFVGIGAVGVNSVVSGTQMTRYDSSANSNIAGFSTTTGIWTVAAAGYYAVNAKLITRINPSDANTVTYTDGSKWMSLGVIDGGIGYLSIGIVVRSGVGAVTNVVTSNKQIVTQKISDVNIECSQGLYYFNVSDQVIVQVLNKTDWTIIGVAPVSGQPDCIVDFSVTKIS